MKKKSKNAEPKLSTDEIMVRQNRVIISLLAKQIFGGEKIKEIVIAKKKNPEAYIKGYNACDGNKSLNDLTKAFGVTPGTLSPILQDWESKGIIFDISSSGRPLYVNLMTLEK